MEAKKGKMIGEHTHIHTKKKKKNCLNQQGEIRDMKETPSATICIACQMARQK